MSSTLKSLKLLADPTRVRMLRLLEEEALSVADLQELLGMGQSTISTQLSQLKGGGLVSDERSGKHNFYRAALPEHLRALVDAAAEEIDESSKDLSSLKHLQNKRRDKTRAYFDELAGKFGRDYVPGRSWKGLAEALLKVINPGVCADLGAGEGTLTQLLAQRATKVIAVDISPKMVEFGKELALRHELHNLDHRLGDIEQVPIESATVDLAFLSQALHHAGDPLKALQEAQRILRPGGKLVILDLLQHHFEEARELYADVWLGFGEGEIATLLEQAGFEKIETAVVDREQESPNFQTLLAVGRKPAIAP
jgi:ubiquinone/menaquinone biosynthesis C-methylase UbiE/biotin operon repressor